MYVGGGKRCCWVHGNIVREVRPSSSTRRFHNKRATLARMKKEEDIFTYPPQETDRGLTSKKRRINQARGLLWLGAARPSDPLTSLSCLTKNTPCTSLLPAYYSAKWLHGHRSRSE